MIFGSYWSTVSKKSKMAALRHWYGCRSFIHLRRGISSGTILTKNNKPTLIEEDSVEVKTVDQTVSKFRIT